MQVNSVEDLDGLPATSSAAPSADTTATAPAPTPGETPQPKQSTIKIQSPPAKETAVDDSITVAMRQAGEEAASKARGDTGDAKQKSKPDPKNEKPHETNTKEKEPETEKQEPNENEGQNKESETVRPRRKSVNPAPEVAGNHALRPPLEVAAVSSENFYADNAEALGLVEHHRGSIVSPISDEERARVARNLRQSISEARADVADPDSIEEEDQR